MAVLAGCDNCFASSLSDVCAFSSPCASTLTIWTGVSGLKPFKQQIPVGFGSPEAGKVHRNSPIRPERTVNIVSSSTSVSGSFKLLRGRKRDKCISDSSTL